MNCAAWRRLDWKSSSNAIKSGSFTHGSNAKERELIKPTSAFRTPPWLACGRFVVPPLWNMMLVAFVKSASASDLDDGVSLHVP